MGMQALIHFLFLITICKVARAQNCEECVDRGCTYCANSAFDHPDTCLCGSSGGFFGNCNDVSFRSEAWESKWDYKFSSKNGEIILGAIVLFPLVAIAVVICVCKGSPCHGSSAGWAPHHTAGVDHHMSGIDHHTSGVDQHIIMLHTMGLGGGGMDTGGDGGMDIGGGCGTDMGGGCGGTSTD